MYGKKCIIRLCIKWDVIFIKAERKILKMNGVGLFIQIIAGVSFLGGIFLLSDGNFMGFIGVLSAVFIFGFGEIILILSDIKYALKVEIRRQRMEDNAKDERTKQMEDATEIEVQADLSFQQMEK